MCARDDRVVVATSRLVAPAGREQKDHGRQQRKRHEDEVFDAPEVPTGKQGNRDGEKEEADEDRGDEPQHPPDSADVLPLQVGEDPGEVGVGVGLPVGSTALQRLTVGLSQLLPDLLGGRAFGSQPRNRGPEPAKRGLATACSCQALTARASA